MKRITTLIIAVFAINILYAQFEEAPWWNEPEDGHKKTFFEIQEEFYDYWKDKDENRRSSGYKIFKRWEYNWQCKIDERGYIPDQRILLKESAKLQRENTLNGRKFQNKWKSLGPFNYTNKGGWNPGVGRINVLVEAPFQAKNNKPSVFYAGGPNGGIWESINDGKTWEPLGDYLSYIGVSGIALDPKNSKVIYISTGDDDAYDSVGIGVWKSEDRGRTWVETGVNGAVTGKGGDIIMDPSNSRKLIVATSDGVFHTSDGGDKWEKATGIVGRIREVRFKPGDSKFVYAANDTTFFRSIDGGKSFTDMKIDNSGSENLAITVTADNPDKVYVIGGEGDFVNFEAKVELFVSENSGETFTKIIPEFKGYDHYELMGYQIWYDLAITASERDENTLYAGFVQLWKSTDGGKVWNLVSGWSDTERENYIHADIHYLRHHNDRLYVGCDGGAYISDDETETFKDLSINGLATSQFYRLAGHPDDKNILVGGLQDNGGFFYRENNWNIYHGADGMEAAVDYKNPSDVYGFTQNAGLFFRSVNGGEGEWLASLPENGRWVTPMAADKDGSFLAGSSKVYRYNVSSNVWSEIGSTEFENLLHTLEIAPSNSKVIYTSDLFLDSSLQMWTSDLYRTSDGGATWEKSKLPDHRFIYSIECDEQNPNLIWATWFNKVFESTDGGKTWTDISDGLPPIFINIVKKKIGNNKELFVGNDLGIWYRNKHMNEWKNISYNFPHVSVNDIEINEKSGLIRLATYGRGVWESTLDLQVGMDDKPLGDETFFNAFPNPTNGKIMLEINISSSDAFLLTVTNMLGQQVFTKELGVIQSALREEIDLSNEINGVYFISLKSNTGVEVKKVIKK